MLMIDLFARHRNLIIVSLAAIIVVVGALAAWWRFPEGTLTAQERMADVCASAQYPDSFDLFERSTYGQGDNSGLVEYDVRVGGNAEHYIIRLDGTLAQEAIFMFSDNPGGSDSQQRSAHRREEPRTSYMRVFNDGGWGEWDVSVSKSPVTGGDSTLLGPYRRPRGPRVVLWAAARCPGGPK